MPSAAIIKCRLQFVIVHYTDNVMNQKLPNLLIINQVNQINQAKMCKARVHWVAGAKEKTH